MTKNKYTDLQIASIGKYRITGRLGKGGMGDIYKAEQSPLKRVVALKVLPPQMQRDEEFEQRFEVEARAISQLEHQNIVSLIDYGEDDGYRYIAMQYIDGMDLGAYIADSRTMTIAEIIDFSKQICRGLRYAHSRGIIHRDIKPQNILLDRGKGIHITDFGIAKVPKFDLMRVNPITQHGLTVGTPEYMSPEQALGRRIDVQTDIYSLGIVMYEMLTRKPPFIGNNPMAIAHMQVNVQPSPPSHKRRDMPKMLDMIVTKALKKDKSERYSTIEELLNDLDRVDPNETVSPRKTVIMPTPKKIEDRRVVDRRVRGTGGFGEMLRTQWPSWIAIGALATAFILHILNHP
ncbi:MAG: protein kinase [Chitinispirillia bacterium]|nr:protein kinase [Chitinispirillia bacterium]MCL2268678.1 protein kinase [Chitinispirillia bacterium]